MLAFTVPLFRRLLISVALALLVMQPLADGRDTRPAHPASFLVDTLADSGVGSLRQAMLDANAAAGADLITFSVSGTIVLASPLPDITDAAGLVIDGTGRPTR